MAIQVKKINLYVYRAPIAVPVKTSFGTMLDRPAVLVRVEDKNGAHGWGEVWCNFPSCGAEHRYRLCETVLAPILLANSFGDLDDTFAQLSQRTHILMLQTRELGPLNQAIAGIMCALADMEARKADMPLHRYLGGEGNGRVPAYASGINPKGCLDTIRKNRDAGYTNFKVKIGFDFDQDLKTIGSIYDILNEGERLYVDVNQAWTFDQAKANIAVLGKFPLGWIEEPIASDNPPERFAELSRINTIPIAGGENIYGFAEFDRFVQANALGVVQPDACKWGGIMECLNVARMILAKGAVYCPHFLGAGIGLWGSAHILACVESCADGKGLLEVDINDNPLQHILAEPRPVFANGYYHLSEEPGIGVEPNLKAGQPFLRMSTTLT